jgi:hypothetical protein
MIVSSLISVSSLYVPGPGVNAEPQNGVPAAGQRILREYGTSENAGHWRAETPCRRNWTKLRNRGLYQGQVRAQTAATGGLRVERRD